MLKQGTKLSKKRKLACSFQFMSALLLAFMLSSGFCQAQAAEPNAEQSLRSAFVYNFLRYTTFPDAVEEREVLPICIVSSASDASAYKKLSKRSIRKKIIQVSFINLKQLSSRTCSVLVFPTDEAETPDLSNFSDRPVLTIGNSPDFVKQGGVIRFFVEDDKLRFEINLATAKRSSLRISSQLLRLARIFKEDKK